MLEKQGDFGELVGSWEHVHRVCAADWRSMWEFVAGNRGLGMSTIEVLLGFKAQVVESVVCDSCLGCERYDHHIYGVEVPLRLL